MLPAKQPTIDNILQVSMLMLKHDLKEKNHFSFILQKNRIIGVGTNHMFKTHPKGAQYGYRYSAIHSELDAFLDLPREIDYRKLKLINVRLSRKSIKEKRPILRMSKPCHHCSVWIKNIGFKEIWYSTDEGWNKFDI